MAEFDSANRELCPDQMCVGVVGHDGRCRECGTVSPSATQHPRNRGMKPQLADSGEVVVPSEIAARQLCPDQMCVGVLGDDGRCKECGSVAAEAVAPATESTAPDVTPDAGRDVDPDDIEHRELCLDDMCVGVVDDNGRCKECGKSAS